MIALSLISVNRLLLKFQAIQEHTGRIGNVVSDEKTRRLEKDA